MEEGDIKGSSVMFSVRIVKVNKAGYHIILCLRLVVVCAVYCVIGINQILSPRADSRWPWSPPPLYSGG